MTTFEFINRSSDSSQPVRIFTLGQFAIMIGDKPLGPKGMTRRRPLELLKGLIALEGRNAHAIQLAESIWPDSEGDQLYGTLTVTLRRLRDLIGQDSVELRDGRLILNEERCWVDLLNLNEHLERLESALRNEDGERVVSSFDSAMDLYKGPFLDGEFDPPEILTCREKTHRRLLRLIHEVGGCHLAREDLGSAIQTYQRGVELDDVAEEAYQGLMKCYLHQGRLAEGVNVYERCAQIFRNNIGIDPSPPTQAIHKEILDVIKQRRQEKPQPDSRLAAAFSNHSVSPPPSDPVIDIPSTPFGRPVEPSDHLAGPINIGKTEGDSSKEPFRKPELSVDREGEIRPAVVACIEIMGLDMNQMPNEAQDIHNLQVLIKNTFLRIVQENGGEVNQFTRNQALVLFGLPQAHEDDPTRAVTTVIRLRDRLAAMSRDKGLDGQQDLTLRVGIATGPIVAYPGGELEGRFDLMGEPIDIATNLAQAARKDDVLVCANTHQQIEPFFRMQPMRHPDIGKGSDSLEAYRVLEPTAINTRFQHAESKGFTPFTGREQELGTLLDRLSMVRDGQGQFVTLVGDAGIGKSRLAYRFMEEVSTEDVTVLMGRCQPMGSNPPYLPISDALRHGLRLPVDEGRHNRSREISRKVRLVDPALETYLPVYHYLLEGNVPDGATPGNQEGEGLRVVVEEAIAALVTQSVAQQPMALLLEDWHWADEASDAILKRLINIVAEYPLCLVLSYRPEYSANWRNLRNHTHISLDPLGRDQTETIAQWMIGAPTLPEGLVDLLYERSEGNPFFIEEICQAMRDGGVIQVQGTEASLTQSLRELSLPDTVQAVVRARVDMIDQQSRSVLRLASIIGQEVPLLLLERILPQGIQLADCLETLQELELIRMIRAFPEVVYRFNHYITQKVVYETILPSQRRLLHNRVGQAIESLCSDSLEEQVEALARHYYNSASTEKAIEYMERAGDKAAHYFSLEEARNYYKQAVDLFRDGEMAEKNVRHRIDLILKWGQISFYHPNPTLLDALELAYEDALKLDDQLCIARTTLWTGLISYGMGYFRQAAKQFNLCLTLDVGEKGNQRFHALAISSLGRVHFYMGDFSMAIDLLKEGIEPLIQLDSNIEAANSMGMLTLAYAFRGNFKDMEATAARMYTLTKKENNPTISSMSHVAHGLALLLKGDWEAAEEVLIHLKNKASRTANPVMEGFALWGNGYSKVLAGNREPGIAQMHEGIAIIELEHSHVALTAFLGFLAILYVEDGNREMGERLANRCLEIKEVGGGRLGEFAAYCALALSAAHDFPSGWGRAQSFIEESLRVSSETGCRPGLGIGSYYYALMLFKHGFTREADDHIKRAFDLFTELDMPYWLNKVKAL